MFTGWHCHIASFFTTKCHKDNVTFLAANKPKDGTGNIAQVLLGESHVLTSDNCKWGSCTYKQKRLITSGTLVLLSWWTPAIHPEKAMATYTSTLAWKMPWTEEPGRLQSMGSLGVRNDWVTSLSLLCIGEGNGNPLQCSCLENPRDGGAWWAAVYGVAQSDKTEAT